MITNVIIKKLSTSVLTLATQNFALAAPTCKRSNKNIMSWKFFILMLAFLIAVCGPSFAAKPAKQPNESVVPAPEVFSVKIDYTNSFIIVEGVNLDPASATATLSGVSLSVDATSTDDTLLFPFSPEVSAVVDELGNYVLNLSTDGGSFHLSVFIPLALVTAPPPPPPGPDCPCSTEWDQKSTSPSPDGFSGLIPYCSEDSGSFVTVQFYDEAAYNYWVLWTEWNAASNSGYCELYIDGPERQLDNQAQFDACAAYLRNIVTVWGNQGNMCLY